eukprot:11066027-Lingulodinium_polyedra.AAC.1
MRGPPPRRGAARRAVDVSSRFPPEPRHGALSLAGSSAGLPVRPALPISQPPGVPLAYARPAGWPSRRHGRRPSPS